MRLRFTRLLKTLVKIMLELSAFTAASYIAFSARYDGHVPAHYRTLWWDVLPLLLFIRFSCTYATTRYRIAWRAVGIADLALVAVSVTIGSIAFWTMVHAMSITYPHGVLLLDWVLSTYIAMGIRVSARVYALLRRSWMARHTVDGVPLRRVLIVGAGQMGTRTVRAIKEDPRSGIKPVGFVDDNHTKWESFVQGVPVLGPISDLPELVRNLAAEQVIVAIPDIAPSRLRDIVDLTEGTPAQLSIMPSLPEMLSGKPAMRLIRRIRVEDLLERTPVHVNMESIAEYLSGQRVLVTGAGGSIGSELCRQIAGFNPEKLIVLGQGEHSIFWIEHELRNEFGLQAMPVIADIKDRVKLEKIFRDVRPTVVFHAAAHKHVPLMELNPEEAIKNNVLGTRNLAELAIEYGVKKFVMISTDKAVNPTSVMGTTKRIAEMVVQSLAQRIECIREGDMDGAMMHLNSIHADNPVTEFAAVRFGNVLGSRGSVIPTMQRQIEKGGPVTVTHPEMVRYFMTIPEAVQLVIQAGAMSQNGEIFILDMGKPVKIMDLARNLIRLSGFRPGQDIEIKITGTRPGEKLYEEVLTAEEGVNVTSHEKIFVARPSRIDHAALHDALERLEFLAQRADPVAIRQALRETVPTYNPKPAAKRPEAQPAPKTGADAIPDGRHAA